MLSLEQIMELQEKGFSYEQLQVLNNMQLSGMAAKPEPAPEPEAKTEPAPEPEAKTEPAPEANVEVTALKNEVAALTATLKEMQAANVSGAKMEPEKPLTADDVIKSFMVAS